MKKDIVMKILVLVVLLCAALLFSCKEYTTNSKCDIPASPSVIEKLIPNPKTADLLFTVANFEALEAGLYTRVQIEAFFSEIEDILYMDDVTLADIAIYSMKKIEGLRDADGRRILLASMYLEVFEAEVQPISAKDRCLITLHLENQRRKVMSLF